MEKNTQLHSSCKALELFQDLILLKAQMDEIQFELQECKNMYLTAELKTKYSITEG